MECGMGSGGRGRCFVLDLLYFVLYVATVLIVNTESVLMDIRVWGILALNIHPDSYNVIMGHPNRAYKEQRRVDELQQRSRRKPICNILHI